MEPKLEILLRTIILAIARKTPFPLIIDIGYSGILKLQVDGEDMGRCVGKNGSTIWAIQSLFWYAGMAQLKFPYKVHLVDPLIKVERHNAPIEFRSDWDRGVIENLCGTIIKTCVPGHASCYLLEEGVTSAVVHLKINKYLRGNMEDPSFIEAFSIIMRSAGLSHGVTIKTEGVFE